MKISQFNTLKRKILSSLAVAFLVPVLSISLANALASTSSTSGSNTAANTTLVNTIMTKGNAEITRRLTSLNTLDSKISSSSKLSSADKSNLTTEVNNEISGLTSLKGTLDACATVNCAKTEAQSIFTEYRVYVLVLPQVNMISAADHQQQVETKLTNIASQLNTRLSASTVSGKDALLADLTAMTNDISAAQKLSSQSETSVSGFTPANYDSNHSLLVQYYGDLKTALSDNQAAYSEAKTIFQALSSKSTGSKTN